MPTGKLYSSLKEELIANVNYNFQHEEEHRWWGELTLIEYKQIKDGGGFIIAPSHHMPGDIPAENMVAFIEAVREG